MSAIVFFGALLLITGGAWVHIPHDSPVEMHNVHVLKRYDALNFCLSVEDPDTHVRNSFGARFCNDYPVSSEIQPGMNLMDLKYEVDYRNQCYSIKADNLGYTWSVDENNHPIFASFAAEAAAQPCSGAQSEAAVTQP